MSAARFAAAARAGGDAESRRSRGARGDGGRRRRSRRGSVPTHPRLGPRAVVVTGGHFAGRSRSTSWRTGVGIRRITGRRIGRTRTAPAACSRPPRRRTSARGARHRRSREPCGEALRGGSACEARLGSVAGRLPSSICVIGNASSRPRRRLRYHRPRSMSRTEAKARSRRAPGAITRPPARARAASHGLSVLEDIGAIIVELADLQETLESIVRSSPSARARRSARSTSSTRGRSC